MVDIQALNALIAGISIAVAVVVGVAMSTIVLVWVADRRRHAHLDIQPSDGLFDRRELGLDLDDQDCSGRLVPCQ